MNNIFNLKQKRVKFLGEFIESFFTAIPILSLFSYVSTTVILWEMIKRYIIDTLPWMNILYFMLFLVVLFLPIVVATFRWVIPSVWHFRSSQMGHLGQKIDELEKKIDELLSEKDASSGSK